MDKLKDAARHSRTERVNRSTDALMIRGIGRLVRKDHNKYTPHTGKKQIEKARRRLLDPHLDTEYVFLTHEECEPRSTIVHARGKLPSGQEGALCAFKSYPDRMVMLSGEYIELVDCLNCREMMRANRPDPAAE